MDDPELIDITTDLDETDAEPVDAPPDVAEDPVIDQPDAEDDPGAAHQPTTED